MLRRGLCFLVKGLSILKEIEDLYMPLTQIESILDLDNKF
jgi:hypothetical protein